MTSIDNEHKLDEEQLRTVMGILHLSKEEIQEAYSGLWKRYPKGFLTKDEFIQKFHESELFNRAFKNIYPSQYLFEVMDQNNSGTIDMYEFLLAWVTLESEDPKVLFDSVFKMFDSDRDGQLTKDELVNALYAYLNMVARGTSSDETKQSKYTLNEIKKNIDEAFGDKAIISKKDLRENVENSEILRSMFSSLHSMFTIGLLFEDSDF